MSGSFRPSGFFALRSPLLPLDELLRWSDGLAAPQATDDLDEALARDRATLRARLREIVGRPEVREAIFVASPSLDESLAFWLADPESERGQRVERALVRYFCRSAGRPTPFGLFAGCATGRIEERTRLRLGGISDDRRRSRLDMEYLDRLVETLAGDPSVRAELVYRVSSSLFRAGGQIRYVEPRLEKDERRHLLVTVEDSEALATTLARAADGARPSELVAALASDEVSAEEAAEFVGDVIDSRILVADLAPTVTGDDPLGALVARLEAYPAADAARAALASVRDDLAAIDASPLGAGIERYRKITERLEKLPAKVERARLFQVDMVKSVAEATLGGRVLDEIVRGIGILHRLVVREGTDSLRPFREAFRQRYEMREVPLLEALDEEIGVGLGEASGVGSETAPLLAGLDFPAGEERPRQGARDDRLLRKVAEAISRGATEIVLEAADVDAMALPDVPPLPDAFAVDAVVAARSDADLDRGEFRVLLRSASGPSGARLLGRFCHADRELRLAVERHLRAEEALDPEAIFAEIVHLPEGRIGNILARPVLRPHEIPYLGESGIPPEARIPASDLLVSVSGDRTVLRSARLGKRVVPRLTSAHNFTRRTPTVYRFLCLLQGEGVADSLGWSWGSLAALPFLPRVVSGRLVLAPATWRIEKGELEALGKERGSALHRAVRAWREARRLPRFVLVADGDNALPVDLDNVLCVESMVQLVRERSEARLTEMLPSGEELVARGPDGSFTHELVVPMIREAEPRKPEVLRGAATPSGFRRRAPGSEWLYAKLYGGEATADRVLRDVVAPLVEAVLASGEADGWFFIRYADPDHHLRLRFRGEPERLHSSVLPALEAAVAPALEDGRVWRLQLDTYDREVERYGGATGMLVAERIFRADSEAVLEILERLDEGDAGGEERWQLALAGSAMLLSDLGLSLAEKRALLEELRRDFAKEFRADVALKRKVGERFAKERARLEDLVELAQGDAHPLAPGFEVLRLRSERIAPLVAELRAAERDGGLSMPVEKLASSYVHMHVNRLLRSAQRAHEMVLYDFLARLYTSKAARRH